MTACTHYTGTNINVQPATSEWNQLSLTYFFLDKESEDLPGNKTLSLVRNDTEAILVVNNLPDGSTQFSDWTTDITIPSLTVIPSGSWRVYVDGKKTAGTKSVQFYYSIYAVNSSGENERYIATSSYSSELSLVRESFNIAAYFPETRLNTTDRIRVKGYAYVSGGGSAPSLEAYIQGASDTRLEFPAPGGSSTSIYPLIICDTGTSTVMTRNQSKAIELGCSI